jgi:hypothetical protein
MMKRVQCSKTAWCWLKGTQVVMKNNRTKGQVKSSKEQASKQKSMVPQTAGTVGLKKMHVALH